MLTRISHSESCLMGLPAGHEAELDAVKRLCVVQLDSMDRVAPPECAVHLCHPSRPVLGSLFDKGICSVTAPQGKDLATTALTRPSYE